MKKVICFDLWKTLAYEPYSSEDYFELALKKYPKKITKEKLVKLIDEIPMKSNFSLEKSVRLMLAKFGIFDRKLSNQIMKRWQYSCDKAELFFDVLPVLRKLQKIYYLVLITNTSKYGWNSINRKFKLSRYFDLVVKSFELGYVKPEAEMFEFVEKKLKISGSNILMIGDSLENDILPAKKRGWRVTRIDREKKNKNQKIIGTLLDLEKKLFLKNYF